MTICALSLALLLDASASINADQWHTQTEAHAEAFEHPIVHSAIRAAGPVYVRALAFADRAEPLTAWALIQTDADAMAYARQLRGVERPTTGGTDIGGAIRAALTALDAGPRCEREVVDLVTDGEASPEAAERARDEAQRLGITINGLGIGPHAAAWLREHAQTPDGFTRQADDWRHVAPALRAKMVREIASR